MRLLPLLMAAPLAAQIPSIPVPTPSTSPLPLWDDKTAPGAVFSQPAAPQAAPVPVPPAPTKGWTDKASLSLVSVGGNAQSQSLGFSNELKVVSGPTSFQLNAAGVRVNSTTVTRSATGTSTSDATVSETRTKATTTEAYTGIARVDQKITDRFFWFGAGSWDRNRPAGLDNRYKAVAGLGDLWINDGATKFRTDYGVGYTKEVPLFQPADYQDSFVTWKNGFTTTLNTRLALKVGYDLSYRNIPNTVGVDVVQTPVSDPPVVIGQVPFPLKRLDSMLSTSLVLTF